MPRLYFTFPFIDFFFLRSIKIMFVLEVVNFQYDSHCWEILSHYITLIGHIFPDPSKGFKDYDEQKLYGNDFLNKLILYQPIPIYVLQQNGFSGEKVSFVYNCITSNLEVYQCPRSKSQNILFMFICLTTEGWAVTCFSASGHSLKVSGS